MATPEPYPYRKLNYPINNLEQSFTQEQKLQTRSNIGIPSSVDNEDKVLMVDNAAGELVWAEAPNGLPDIASGDEGKFLSVENGEPAWTDVDIPEQVNADWDATSGVQEILNKPNLATVATTGQYADLSGKPDIPASTSELVNDSGFITLADVPTPPAQLNADWDATSGVQEILNKPASKRVYAGNNITITEDADGFTISSQSEQQVNADWDATSGVAEILHKPTIPTATSDLTNDSGFITLSDVPAQVNADWDSNSGASEILNKPDLSIYAETANLATVATTGSYDDLSDKPTIPPAQVNSDWNSNSGVSQILNKPNLSTVATTGDYNDLSNKPSIPAAQVNADWDSTSGVSEILNKPTLAAVATSGDYADLSNTPSIPTATSDLTNDSGFITLSDVPAQVQSDWTESDSSDPAYIQNKPNLAAVATSGDYSDLSNTPTISNVPAVTSSDNDKVLKASYSGGVGSYSWEEETGTTYSAGTGIDITSNTISVENPLPASTSTDADKVLKVDSQGAAAWTSESAVNLVAGSNITLTQSGNNLTISSTGGGGGGGGVNADWDETDPLEPSYIENKPTPKTLTAGANISISEGVGTLTISAAAGLPASTSADEGKCLVVDSNGDPEWGTGGKTYTGTDGVVVDNVNDTVGLEAPVDLVAGPGIAIDNPDGNTVRISRASSEYNETVLWENYTFASNKSSSVVMSENPFNFSCVRITFEHETTTETWPTVQTQIVDMVALNSCVNKYFTLNGTCVNGSVIYARCSKCHFNGTAINDDSSVQWYNGGSGSMAGPLHIYRIVGINRIANN